MSPVSTNDLEKRPAAMYSTPAADPDHEDPMFVTPEDGVQPLLPFRWSRRIRRPVQHLQVSG
jgi:hypothetical protein